MYIRKSIRSYKGRTYTNYVLVESIHTPKGPRQKTICSLGDLGARSREEWLKLTGKIEDALVGQGNLLATDDAEVADIVRRVKTRRVRHDTDRQERGRSSSSSRRGDASSILIKVDPARVATERHREAGPVHVGYQFWQRLELDRILRGCGLSATTRRPPNTQCRPGCGAPRSAIFSTPISTPLQKTRFTRCSTNSISIVRPSRLRSSNASAACSISTRRSISTISPRPISKASVSAMPRPSAATRAITGRIVSRWWSPW